MLQDSQASVVVTQNEFAGDLAQSGAEPLVLGDAAASSDGRAGG